MAFQKSAAKETSGLRVLKKLKVHIYLKNHRNSLLFGYYKLGFRSLGLHLFSHCFNLKDLNFDKDLLFT